VRKCDVIVHAGDIGNPAVLETLQRLAPGTRFAVITTEATVEPSGPRYAQSRRSRSMIFTTSQSSPSIQLLPASAWSSPAIPTSPPSKCATTFSISILAAPVRAA
jgi:hypothetical protein